MPWPENPAFVLIARDKAPWVGNCVRTMLEQKGDPITLVFSDQSSTDGTAQVIREEVSKYKGPHKTLLLNCPVTKNRGMLGLIDHLNWLHKRLMHEGFDYILQMSADDIAGEDRCQRTIEELRRLDAEEGRRPLFFGTAQIFAEEHELQTIGVEGSQRTVSKWPEQSQWITPIEHLQNRVGGSSSNAWDPNLIEAIYPVRGFALVDVFLPFVAALMGGFYFLREFHHVYVRRPDPANTGLEGRLRMAQNEIERTRWREMIHSQLLTNNLIMLDQIREVRQNPDWAEDPNLVEIEDYLVREEILGQATALAQERCNLTLARVPPMPMPI